MNLILIGHKNAGKTTVGEYLAAKLQYTFIDTDALLLEREKIKNIASLFERLGEKKFREKESLLIQSLEGHGQVIATGGGSLLDTRNAQHLEHLGHCFYLHVDFDTLQLRNAQSSKHGILTTVQNPFLHYEKRDALYRTYAADVIECTQQSTEEIAASIMRRYEYGK